MNNDKGNTTISSTVNLSQQMYGVWIKGKGWLRVNDEKGKEFGDYSIEVAKEVAKNIGGVVRFIDKSLIDLENQFLDKERKSLWVTFQNLWQHKINTWRNSKTTKAL